MLIVVTPLRRQKKIRERHRIRPRKTGAARRYYALEKTDSLLSQLTACLAELAGIDLLYAKAGRRDDARRLLSELDEREDRGEYITPFARLTISVGFGEIPEIRRLLTACIADHTPAISIAGVCGPLVEAFRSDSEINRLLDTIFGPR